MRVERVYTNETCNQRCGHCNTRRPREEPGFVAPAATRARIDAALAGGATEIVLAGGEPTLRRDLERLVAHARKHGAERIVLLTNAATIDAERARSVAEAGVDVARVHLPAWGSALDTVTQDPGGFEATRRGLAALDGAGVVLEALVPVVHANLESVATMPQALAASGLPWSAIVASVPLEAHEPQALAPLDDAVRALQATEAAARRAGIEIRLDPDTYVPPCLFPYPARVARLFALTRGGAGRPGWTQVAACEGCAVGDRCPGLPQAALARGDAPAAEPIREDRLRRRLSVISSVPEQVARELYQDEVNRRPDGEAIPQRIVRINFRCNQACHFCFVSTHLPAAEDAAVERAIVEVARAGGIVVLSGGEPTLNPRLTEYVRLAKSEGARGVELQTNAMRVGDAARVRELADAGVDEAFVSLHGSRAEISDVVTNAPGTFEQTVRGIDALHDSDIVLRLNFVFCATNREDFPAYVDMVAARWPEAVLCVSFVAPSTDVVPRTPDLVPRYSDVLPHLAEGMRRAERHGLRVTGFESMCGVPLCLVPADVSHFFELAEIPGGVDGGELVKPAPCNGCALSGRCFGLRRGYAELHGTSELRPVRAEASQRRLDG